MWALIWWWWNRKERESVCVPKYHEPRCTGGCWSMFISSVAYRVLFKWYWRCMCAPRPTTRNFRKAEAFTGAGYRDIASMRLWLRWIMPVEFIYSVLKLIRMNWFRYGPIWNDRMQRVFDGRRTCRIFCWTAISVLSASLIHSATHLFLFNLWLAFGTFDLRFTPQKF